MHRIPASPPAGKRRRYAKRLPAPERREQLLEVAMGIVVADGYSGLTMEAIAREAGVTKPVVYDSFANRDDVMQTLLDREEERAVAEILAAIGAIERPGTDLPTFVAESVSRVLAAIAARPEAYRVILLQIEGTPPLVRERIDAGRAKIVARVQAVVAAATRRRDGTPTVDEELLALGVVGMGEQAAILLLRDPARFRPERFETTLRQLMAGFSPLRPG